MSHSAGEFHRHCAVLGRERVHDEIELNVAYEYLSEVLVGGHDASGVPNRPPDVQPALTLGSEGTLRWSVQARPPQSDPELPQGLESGIDYVARGPLGELKMQVTRVPTDEGYYRSLGKVGRAGADSTAQDLADDVIAAIRHKAPPGREVLNEGVTLLLDAQHSLAHGFVQVLDDFDVRHQADAVACRFRDIWLLSALHFHRVSPGEWLERPR